MSDSVSVLQPSDYSASDIGLQDYDALGNEGLAAPTLDSPVGVDPFSGLPLTNPTPGDSLTQLPPDASDGLNAYNDGLLPLSPSATVDTSVYDSGSAGNASTMAFSSTGNGLDTIDNLPLAPIASVGASLTKLGSATITKPNPNPGPLGSSLWGSILGFTSSVLGGGKSAGVSGGGATAPGSIKKAPNTTLGNPISNGSTVGIFLVVFAILGLVIWSLSGE